MSIIVQVQIWVQNLTKELAPALSKIVVKNLLKTLKRWMFKHRQNFLKSLEYNWRPQGVTIPFFSSDSATCVHEHFETKLVEMVGFEPTMPEAADLQSAGVTNFPTHP